MRKVLFIDDDPIAIMVYSTIIKKYSFANEVVTAKNGQEAIQYYESLSKSSLEEKSNYPEFIFLDLNMPVMNGWEFLDEFIKKFYESFPKTKVVILTSSIDPMDQERASNYSIAVGFRSKPLTIEILKDLRSTLRKVLIIDDEEDTGELVSKILMFEGFSTIYVNNGLLGIKKALEIKPDIIICDILMPKMDGYEVLNEIRKIHEIMYTPFIFLSASIDKKDIRKGMATGADDYITKPFDPKDLLEAVHSGVNKRILIEDIVQKEVNSFKDEIKTIQSNEKLFSSILHSTHDIVVIHHYVSGQIVFFNNRIDTIVPDLQCIDKTLSILDFTHPDDLEIVKEIPSKVRLLKNDEVASYEFRLKTVCGEYIYFSNQVSVFKRDKDGYPLLYLSILHDINDSKEKMKLIENFYERISEDLSLANSTQAELISFEIPKIESFEFKVFYKSMEKVGGDFLVTKKLENGNLDIFAGDVSGHGISSSLVSAMAVVAFKMINSIEYLPNEILHKLHESLENLVKNHFISAAYIRLNSDKKSLTISFAGHPPLLLIRGNKITILKEEGTFLILFPSPTYLNLSVDLQKGDKFLLFSDGFYEAFDPTNKLIGYDGFVEWVQEITDKPIDSIIQDLVERTLIYSNNNVHDDMTLFGFQYD